jgi:hypothetical protein
MKPQQHVTYMGNSKQLITIYRRALQKLQDQRYRQQHAMQYVIYDADAENAENVYLNNNG